GTLHYRDFQYSMPCDRAVSVQWAPPPAPPGNGSNGSPVVVYTVSAIIHSPKGKEHSGNGVNDLLGAAFDQHNNDDGGSGTTSTALAKEFLGRPSSTLVLSFSPRISSVEFERLCHEATEFA